MSRGYLDSEAGNGLHLFELDSITFQANHQDLTTTRLGKTSSKLISTKRQCL